MGKGSKKGGRKGGRKGMCAFLLSMMLATPAFAQNTGNTFFHSHSIPDEAFVDTDTDTQRQDWGYGLGTDIVVYESKNPLIESVEVQGRYDIENRETRVFGVVKVNLYEVLGGK